MIALRSLIGKPWAVPCDGVNSFDCWELTLRAREMLGLKTPSYVDRRDRKPSDRRSICNPPKNWEEISEPTSGCVVRMGDTHVGVFIGSNQVIHSQRGHGVRVDKIDLLGRAEPITFWELQNA